jgi:hypothetical protein
MADQTASELIQVVRDLLREGRVNEADKQLDTMQQDIRRELEQRKRDLPPPEKRTLAELQVDFARQVTDLLGNPPRLLNLIEEIKAEQTQPEPQ